MYHKCDANKKQLNKPYPVAQAIWDNNKNVRQYDATDIIKLLDIFDDYCLPEHSQDSSVYSQTHLLFIGLFLAATTKHTNLEPVVHYLQKKWIRSISYKQVSTIIASLREQYSQEEMCNYLCVLMANNPQYLALTYQYLTKAIPFKEEFANAFDYHNIRDL